MKTQVMLLTLMGMLVFPVCMTFGQKASWSNDEIAQFATESQQLLAPGEMGLLNRVAFAITDEYDREKGLDVLLIDYDNSVFSQMAEVWMQTALLQYNITGIRVRSAGIDVGRVDMDALKTFDQWGIKVKRDKIHPETMFEVDNNGLRFNLFAKNITPDEARGIVLLVDKPCAAKYLGDDLKTMNLLRFELGPSDKCMNGDEIDYAMLNREIGHRVMVLARQIKMNMIQKEAVRKHRMQR